MAGCFNFMEDLRYVQTKSRLIMFFLAFCNFSVSRGSIPDRTHEI